MASGPAALAVVAAKAAAGDDDARPTAAAFASRTAPR